MPVHGTAAPDLSKVIIPFFEEHPLITAKVNDFKSFAVIVRMWKKASTSAWKA